MTARERRVPSLVTSRVNLRAVAAMQMAWGYAVYDSESLECNLIMVELLSRYGVIQLVNCSNVVYSIDSVAPIACEFEFVATGAFT